MKSVNLCRVEDKSVLGIADHEERLRESLSDSPFLMLHSVVLFNADVLALPLKDLAEAIDSSPGVNSIYDLSVKEFHISLFEPGDKFFFDWIAIEARSSHDESKPNKVQRALLEKTVKTTINTRIKIFTRRFTPFEKYLVDPELHLAAERLSWNGDQEMVGNTSFVLLSRVHSIDYLRKVCRGQFEVVREGSFRTVATYVNSASLAKARAFEKWERIDKGSVEM